MNPQVIKILPPIFLSVLALLIIPVIARLFGSRSSKPFGYCLLLVFSVSVIFLGLAIGPKLAGMPFVLDDESHSPDLTPVVSPTILSTPGFELTPEFVPTPIPPGELLMESNFSRRGEGQCNDYDPSIIGYEDRKYYIRPQANGYLAVCHAGGSLEPEGSLQVTAFPEGNPSGYVYYGFGVMFGWRGSGLSTTDACMFGVRRMGGRTQAVFMERVDGDQSTSTERLDWLTLDNNPHTLRVVLQPDGSVQGYLDERFLASHRFTQCSAGPIGLVAWGPGDLKINFDDLKLFTLP